jgi:hypothetical protein
MKRRREHGECETRPGGRGCLVVGTAVCEVRKEKMAREVIKRRLGRLLGRERPLYGFLIALFGVVFAGWAMLRMQSMETTSIK